MSDITISRKHFVEAMERAEIDTDDLRENYSGRGMYGATCPGITLYGYAQLGVFLVELTGVLAEEAASDESDPWDVLDPARELARRTATDQMGHGIIAYWPCVTLTD